MARVDAAWPDLGVIGGAVTAGLGTGAKLVIKGPASEAGGDLREPNQVGFRKVVFQADEEDDVRLLHPPGKQKRHD